MDTEFDLKVWEAISRIPRGFVRTYSQIASDIGKPKAVRAVASACGRNKKLVVIPCHRVVRKDGKLGGYSGTGGLDTKKKLLLKEGVDPESALKFTY